MLLATCTVPIAANSLQIADQLLRTGQVEKALAHLLGIEDEYRDNAVFYWLLASAYVVNGERDLAADAAMKAFAVTPSPQALDYRRLGTVLYQANRHLEAKTAFERAYELAPDDMWTVFHLALILHKQGELNNDVRTLRQAEELWLTLEQLVEMTEELPTLAYYYLGDIYRNRGEKEKTVYYWQRFFAYHEPSSFEESVLLLQTLSYLKSL